MSMAKQMEKILQREQLEQNHREGHTAQRNRMWLSVLSFVKFTVGKGHLRLLRKVRIRSYEA